MAIDLPSVYVPQARTSDQPSRRSALILVSLVVSISIAAAAYMLVPLVRKVGWTPPIDDAYIHYQYAWQLARGRFFRFHPGDPVSTGETSPLYAFLLAAFEIFRFSRPHLIAISQMLGAPLLAGTLLLSARAVRRETHGIGSDFATVVIVAIHGFLSWMFFCGMETGLYLLALAAILHGIATWRDGEPAPRTLVAAAALTPLARPDGILAAAIVATLVLLRRADGRRRALARAGIIAAPFVLYMIAIWIATGRLTTAGLEMKAIPYLPYLDRSARIDKIVENVIKAFHDLLQGGRLLLGGHAEYALPWEWMLALVGWVGAIAQDFRARRVGVGTVGAILIPFSLVAGAQVGVSQWRGERYQAPTFFLMTFGIALMIGFVAVHLPRLRADIGLSLAFALAFAPNLAHWRDSFVTDASTIHGKQAAAASFVRDHLPRDARVLVCDAGALGFLSDRWTYDAVGLTTAMRGNSYIAGPGSRFEELEHWPRARWPNYAAIYYWCSWDGVETQQLSQHVDLRVETFADPGLGTGEQPTLAHAGYLVDSLDVADLDSEARHRWHEGDGGGRDRNLVVRGAYAGQHVAIADGVRQVQDSVEFVMRGHKGARGILVPRLQGGPPLAVTVNAVKINLPGGSLGEWLEPEIDLGAIKDDTIRVRIEVPPKERLRIGHVWLYEQSERR